MSDEIKQRIVLEFSAFDWSEITAADLVEFISLQLSDSVTIHSDDKVTLRMSKLGYENFIGAYELLEGKIYHGDE